MNWLRTTGAILLLSTLPSCATQQLSDEEREWQRAMDRENWAMCQKLYQQAGQFTISDHIHDKSRRHRQAEIKSDLMLNSCRRLLGEYWAE